MDSRTRLLLKTGDKYRNFLSMQQVVRMDGKVFRKGGIWAISRIHIIVVDHKRTDGSTRQCKMRVTVQ